MNYFGISKFYTPIPELDHWIRRRLRMCLWKQWRFARTKVRELKKLGVFLKPAISVAMSRKGPWRLSHTLATQSGITNDWLHKTLGLVCIKSIWISGSLPFLKRSVRSRKHCVVGTRELRSTIGVLDYPIIHFAYNRFFSNEYICSRRFELNAKGNSDTFSPA